MDSIGIDPGCTVTAWAIFKKDILHEYGSIRAKSDMSFEDKVFFIINKLKYIIEKYNIKQGAIENSYVNMLNPYSSLKLATLRGSIMALFNLNNIKVHIFTPTQIKKTITGNGHASKEDIVKKVQEITNIHIKSKDINDAIATCICLLKQI